MRPLHLLMSLFMLSSFMAAGQAQGEVSFTMVPAVTPTVVPAVAPAYVPLAAVPEVPAALAGTSDDADLQFVRGMMDNHKRAIEMAKNVLTQGVDPDLRMLAGDILKTQGQELETLEKWMASHGPKAAGNTSSKPKPPVMKARPRPTTTTPKPLGELLDDMESETPAPVAEPVAVPVPEEPVNLFDEDMSMPLLDDMGAAPEGAAAH